MDRCSQRPFICGKFIYDGKQKLYLKGVTYGPFRPDNNGSEYHTPSIVRRDFAHMVTHGINAVRTYTIPPLWLLDLAHEYGLWLLIGLVWEQHTAFLDQTSQTKSITHHIRTSVQRCAHHPAILGFSLGNEIPASIVRWYGRSRIERFLKQLYHIVKTEAPDALVTYVNYPTTEYLDLSFLDFVSFNVYLETEIDFATYLAHLQMVAGNRPLLMAEVGLDSYRHGEKAQAEVLTWQIKQVFAAGCMGSFVYAWTDEWHRGGYDIEDWDFGLTRRNREPKLALTAVQNSYAHTPFPTNIIWPAITVVVCTHNGAYTLMACCQSLQQLNYSNYEVIIVDDGSTDDTTIIAQNFKFQLIRTAHAGLSQARNIGLAAATGEIIAYTDDDTEVDPDWLTYMAISFLHSNYVGIGGPNIPPISSGYQAAAIANAPGGPIHVLRTAVDAEHIPGCNMAFRTHYLRQIGGFDTQFHVAGDDVDICWRLQAQGWRLGFSPAAMVWHQPRHTLWAFFKQQIGYGRAEALLERKWPQKYNWLGHINWGEYGHNQHLSRGLWRWRIYHGVWGHNLFQSLYPDTTYLWSLFFVPEWFLILIFLLGLTSLGLAWPPLFGFSIFFLFGIVIVVGEASVQAAKAQFPPAYSTQMQKLGLYTVTMMLYLWQPLARLWGRWQWGLTFWRRRREWRIAIPMPRQTTFWCEQWRSNEERLTAVEKQLIDMGLMVQRGGDFDRWDLEAVTRDTSRIRLLMAQEEHGGGQQFVRFRLWPRLSGRVLVMTVLFALLTMIAVMQHAKPPAPIILGAISSTLLWRIVHDGATTMGTTMQAITTVFTSIEKETKKTIIIPSQKPEAGD